MRKPTSVNMQRAEPDSGQRNRVTKAWKEKRWRGATSNKMFSHEVSSNCLPRQSTHSR